MEMLIDTDLKLESNMKVFKLKATKLGATPFMLYPMYCEYYQENADKFKFSNVYVYDKACEFFVENMEE